MKFERENTKSIDGPSAKMIQSSLGRLKGTKSSFATLSDDKGNHIQMVGGGYSCFLEVRIDGELFRASQEPPIVPWREETMLEATCGKFMLKPEQYFNIEQVQHAFICFLEGHKEIDYLAWEVICP